MANSIKHMFLLGVLLLCFLSAITEGRTLGVKLEHKCPEKAEPQVHKVEQKQVDAYDLSVAEGDEVLVVMDYTPASRKSPVHN